MEEDNDTFLITQFALGGNQGDQPSMEEMLGLAVQGDQGNIQNPVQGDIQNPVQGDIQNPVQGDLGGDTQNSAAPGDNVQPTSSQV